MAKVTRNSHIKVRVSDAEKQEWLTLADAAGLSVSDLIRAAMQQPIIRAPVPKRNRRPAPAVDPQLLRNLANAGNNLNQLARAVNMYGFEPEDSARMLLYLSAMHDHLAAIRHQHTETAPAGEEVADAGQDA